MIDENISPEDTEVQTDAPVATDTEDNSGQDVKDEIPTPQVPEDLAPEALEAYNAAIESAKKEMQAGLTKKFQGIADEKKDIASLRDKAKLYDEIKAQEEAKANELPEDATEDERIEFYLKQQVDALVQAKLKPLEEDLAKRTQETVEEEAKTQLEQAKKSAEDYGFSLKILSASSLL